MSVLWSAYSAVFVVLSCACAGMYFATVRGTAASQVANPNFRSFKHMYLLAYVSIMTADWLQGPYLYKLYAYYGFEKTQIAVLYVTGFLSSMLCGTVVGVFADKYGRRRASLACCLIMGLSCLTKFSNSLVLLLMGRVFGGIATSLLLTVFEAWMICQHTVGDDFPSEWLTETFSEATFANGLTAIAAGVVASFVAEHLEYGPVAPFAMALLPIGLCASVVWRRWTENYGDRKASVCGGLADGARVIAKDARICLLGVVQCSFEAAMYIFVFLWTPAMETSSPAGANHRHIHVPLGMVFASFMVSIMIGSQLFRLLRRANFSVSVILRATLLTAAAALAVPFLMPQLHYAMLLSFCIFELCCGIYFPSLGTLRSETLEEATRAGVMNLFRVPVNLFVSVTLLQIDDYPGVQLFAVATALVLVSLLANEVLQRRLNPRTVVVAASTEQTTMAVKTVAL